MKFSDRIIKILVDFEYGRNKGLGIISVLFSFATLVEVLHAPRYLYFILIPLMLILTWLWGLFLRKINFRKRETQLINEENKMFVDIYKKLK